MADLKSLAESRSALFNFDWRKLVIRPGWNARDPNDPVNGSGSILFSRTAMPKLTMGFGNMIKRRENQHWSVPFEIGAAYTGHDTIQFNLAGSACQQGICQSVNNPSIQQNVTQEQNKINEEAKRFQIYPILTTGVSYRF